MTDIIVPSRYLEHFDVVVSVASPEYVKLFARESALKRVCVFLLSSGYASAERVWSPVEDVPKWHCLAFERDTSWGRELARKIVEHCNIRIGFISGNRTIETVHASAF